MSSIVSGAGIGSSTGVMDARQTGLALINALGKPSVDTTGNKTAKADSSALPASSSKTPDPPNASTAPAKSASSTVQLSDEAKATVQRLQARDRQVRAHEQAHLAASGGLATTGASYTYQKGPDGARYAVGGEVSIDVSPGRTPQETIARAITIRAAALAPVDPSGPDRAVAAQASQMEQKARSALAAQPQGQAATQSQHTPAKAAAAYAAVSDSGNGDASHINSYA
ncbi:putative metalloprotease CJM1_0395 family protein [Undibacterium sp. Ren11W]|uniref:putative metalloprotease CJM1_0395 family protein n=1 Tax=Undibacterium sp. Ren11W TaxID=3413045 RepID=UPI003BF323A7